MTPELTRRQAIKSVGGAVAVAGGAGLATGSEQPSDAVVDADRNGEGDYPRCLYKPDDDGEWNPLLPINVHAHAPGEESALETIQNSFSGLSNLEWTPAFPDATAKAWDSDAERLVSPDDSYRRPRLGDEWNHVHIWAVDADRAAIHAHLDVVDVSASHLHHSAHYDNAAEDVVDHLREDSWREETPYDINYGVSDERLEGWGETGDSKLEY